MPNLTKDEPVLVVAAVGAVLSYTGSALVAHGVIGADVMTSAEQTVVPIVAAGVVMLLGAVTRALVAPYARVKRLLERDYALTDADFARFQGLVQELSGVDLDPTGEPPLEVANVPEGMAAGQPAQSGA